MRTSTICTVQVLTDTEPPSSETVRVNLCVPVVTYSVKSNVFSPCVSEPDIITALPFFHVYEQSTVSPSASTDVQLNSMIALSLVVIVNGDEVTLVTVNVVAAVLPPEPPVITNWLFTDSVSPSTSYRVKTFSFSSPVAASVAVP